jgi:hypothetical protein
MTYVDYYVEEVFGKTTGKIVSTPIKTLSIPPYAVLNYYGAIGTYLKQGVDYVKDE